MSQFTVARILGDAIMLLAAIEETVASVLGLRRASIYMLQRLVVGLGQVMSEGYRNAVISRSPVL
jgi:hypothetical protein